MVRVRWCAPVYEYPRASVAVRNLRVNPEVIVLMEDGRGRVTRIRGAADFTRDARVRRRSAFRAALKYHLSPGGLADFVSSLSTLHARARYYAERVGDSGVVVITPRIVEVLEVPE